MDDKKDAERYRWLRTAVHQDGERGAFVGWNPISQWGSWYSGAELDAAIDVAISAQRMRNNDSNAIKSVVSDN